MFAAWIRSSIHNRNDYIKVILQWLLASKTSEQITGVIVITVMEMFDWPLKFRNLSYGISFVEFARTNCECWVEWSTYNIKSRCIGMRGRSTGKRKNKSINQNVRIFGVCELNAVNLCVQAKNSPHVNKYV